MTKLQTKTLFILVLSMLLINSGIAYSQDVIYNFEDENVSLPANTFYYLDESHLLDFEDVTKPTFNNFKQSKAQRFSFGKASATAWLKIEVENKTHPQIQDWYLTLDYPSLDSIEFYFQNEVGSFEKRLTGDFFTFNSRPVFDVNYIFPIDLSKKTKQTFYLRVVSQGSLVFPIQIVSKGQYIKSSQHHTILFGLFYGVMLIMLFYNLVIFLASKDVNYLFYVIALIGHLLFMSVKNGHSYQYVLGENPYLGNLFLEIGIAIWLIGDVLFTKSFIETKKYIPKLDKILSLLLLTGVLMLILPFVIEYRTMMKVASLVSLFLVITLITSGITAWLKGNTAARFFVFAWTGYAIGIIIYVLNTNGLIPDNNFTFYAMEVGSVLEIILLSLALVDKFRIIREEKVLAQENVIHIQEKANNELEQKVTERTVEINNQKEELHLIAESVAEKNRYLTNGLNYAKTIQEAILPSEKKILEIFPNHFIIFQPKDVVSGDFYWFTKVENKIFVAVVDCTGHGVPGAFMSIVGASLLNKIIKELKILDPVAIFDRLNIEVIETLKQGQDKNRDGMDVCFCLLEEVQEGTKLTYVGAKRPLFVYQNHELTEIKGTRKSIAGAQNNKTFTQEELFLNKGDVIYLTSDGYIDQANEVKQRFGTPRLKKMLYETAPLSMSEQEKIVVNTLKDYQQQAPQRDDIAMIGIRI